MVSILFAQLQLIYTIQLFLDRRS